MGQWTLDQLNAMDRQAFADALGGLFEHTPRIAETAWDRRPFRSKEELYRTLLAAVPESDETARLVLIRAHPDLGSRISMTKESSQEQAGAGLNRLSGRERRYLTLLNGLYKETFGFPFIMAVKGATKEAIIHTMQRRIRSAREAELEQAWLEVCRIVRFRLDDLVAEEGDSFGSVV